MDKLIKIGKIVAPHGIKGQVRVYNYSTPNRFDTLPGIIVDSKEFRIEKSGHAGNMVILKLESVDDRSSAESMRNKDIFMEEEFLEELSEDEYFISDLIGLDVYRVDSESLGKIKDVLQHGPVDIYEIELNSGKMAYIPAVKEFIKEVDMTRGLVIDTIPGLIDDED